MSKEQIAALEHAFIVATTTDEVMAFMDDDHVRYDDVAPLQMTGPADPRASFDQFFDNCREPGGHFMSLQVEVEADDRIGVAHSLMHFTWKDATGTPAEAAFRVTHCLRKKGDHWKIYHSHVSFPINPATGMAEMNLNA